MDKLAWGYKENTDEYTAYTIFCVYRIEAVNFTQEFRDNCEQDYARNIDAFARQHGYVRQEEADPFCTQFPDSLRSMTVVERARDIVERGMKHWAGLDRDTVNFVLSKLRVEFGDQLAYDPREYFLVEGGLDEAAEAGRKAQMTYRPPRTDQLNTEDTFQGTGYPRDETDMPPDGVM
jgi:hypothetical protein